MRATHLCSFYERIYPRLLEILATDADRFQRLLDVTFGAGRIGVVSFRLADRSPSGSGAVESEPLYASYHGAAEAAAPEAPLEALVHDG